MAYKQSCLMKAHSDTYLIVREINKHVQEDLPKRIQGVIEYLEKTIQGAKKETMEKIDSIDWETHEEEIVKGLTKEMGEISTVLGEKVRESIEEVKNRQEITPKDTYANIAKTNIPRTMHSIILESENKNDTAEELIQKTKAILKPTLEEIKIDKIRKVKDQRVLIGCAKEKEIEKIKDKLQKEQGIKIEKVKNKNPLVIIKDVPFQIKEEELLQLIQNQNKELFNKEEEKEVKVKFRRKAINQERCHAIIQVKPAVWRAMTGKGHLYIEMERLKVEDQSPLIQCTRCLGFGHGMKFCQESASRCSHCGDPHLRANCPEREAGRAPRCCNCAHAGLEETEHNAFSKECGVRDKWEYLARTTTAYE
ncbi:unnamed protein product [Diatraea saccharalis]|uniref:Gag-like protein n=1 Tax=Diatraea saccharalis TaxID=40085 RepID=A0A9N9RAZ4_9NEOP|nr:unnamed protein product [Diatraea saccharalis]